MLTGFRLGNGGWIEGPANKIAGELASNFIGQILEELAKPIAGIQLPSFSCMALDGAKVNTIGGGNSHLNITGNLKKISDKCDISIENPPKVAYGRGVGTPMTCSSEEDTMRVYATNLAEMVTMEPAQSAG